MASSAIVSRRRAADDCIRSSWTSRHLIAAAVAHQRRLAGYGQHEQPQQNAKYSVNQDDDTKISRYRRARGEQRPAPSRDIPDPHRYRAGALPPTVYARSDRHLPGHQSGYAPDRDRNHERQSDGIRHIYTRLVPNFMGFTAVGLLIVAMMGVGVARKQAW